MIVYHHNHTFPSMCHTLDNATWQEIMVPALAAYGTEKGRLTLLTRPGTVILVIAARADMRARGNENPSVARIHVPGAQLRQE